jgi:tetratricopeptide (TPR) repeat protein
LKQPWLKITFLCIVLLLLSFWTFERNRVWSDRITLWSDSAAKSPDKARPHNNLGVALKGQGRLQEAVSNFSQTIRLDPKFTEAYYNLGNTYVSLGRDDEAVLNYKKALELAPENAIVHASLGNALFNRWRLEEAQFHYAEAVRLNPQDMKARINLASVQQMLRARKSRNKQLGN